MKLYDVIRKEDIERGTPLKEIPLNPKFKRQKRQRKSDHPRALLWKKIIVAALVIAAVIAVYLAGMWLVRAKVVITQHEVPFTLDNVVFTAVPQTAASADQLTFQTMRVSDTVSRQVYGSQISQVTHTAGGQVVFFNDYSTAAQTVKAKTKLTAANGKVYETTQAVKVPGYTTNNKVKTAGTSAATPIVALGTGPSYNSDGTSFTVSGWSGSKAKQFFAQSSGSIAGGEDGAIYSVTDDQKGDVVATLQSDLLERLKRDTRAQIPENFLTFPDLEVMSINTDALQLSGTSVKFPASMQGTMVAYLFPRDQLEAAIGEYILNDHPYGQVSIPTLANFTVTPLTPLPTDPTDTPATLQIGISGQGTIIAQASLAAIQQALVGVPKRTFAAVLSAVPEVDTARYHLYPFWAPLFPRQRSRITVQTDN
ncbi:MAG TPA: hypothetical protein VG621_01430 [Candidatus Paceibacterota bacterium]|nr:hypothetical protein [Candidatus Paceibacterota bacterium]